MNGKIEGREEVWDGWRKAGKKNGSMIRKQIEKKTIYYSAHKDSLLTFCK